MNNTNAMSTFIRVHSDVNLVRNLFVDGKDANKLGIDKDSAVVFMLKNDGDIFVLNADDMSIVKVTEITNIVGIYNYAWVDNSTVTSTEWIGFVNGNDIPADHKLRKFADDLIRFIDGDDWVDVNYVSINADKHIITPE